MTRPALGEGLSGIAPLIAVSHLAASKAFYADALGFAVRIESAEHRFALMERGDARIGLLGGADAEALAATANHVAAYLYVPDLDSLWSELAPRLADLPEGRVRPPFTQDYGVREFHVKDPDGALLFFGEASAAD